jgi:hypothetical protein
MSKRQRAANCDIIRKRPQYDALFALVKNLDDAALKRVHTACKTEQKQRKEALRLHDIGMELGIRIKLQQYFMSIGKVEFAADILRIEYLSGPYTTCSRKKKKKKRPSMEIRFALKRHNNLLVTVSWGDDGYTVSCKPSGPVCYSTSVVGYLPGAIAYKDMWISLLLGETDFLSIEDYVRLKFIQ